MFTRNKAGEGHLKITSGVGAVSIERIQTYDLKNNKQTLTVEVQVTFSLSKPATNACRSSSDVRQSETRAVQHGNRAIAAGGRHNAILE